MALRVARGLFRLWLVLSVLWIGGVGVVTYLNFPPRLLSDEEAGFPPVPPGFVVDQPNALRWQAVQTGAEVAIVPPMLVLALGSALVWVFRGFR
jgi:hypothetical protein